MYCLFIGVDNQTAVWFHAFSVMRARVPYGVLVTQMIDMHNTQVSQRLLAMGTFYSTTCKMFDMIQAVNRPFQGHGLVVYYNDR